jgi:hypothetical protein
MTFSHSLEELLMNMKSNVFSRNSLAIMKRLIKMVKKRKCVEGTNTILMWLRGTSI